jgi:hypothetical protein
MSALVLPSPGSHVRVATRTFGLFFGDVVDAKLMSGRWPIAPWGLERTLCVASDDVLELELLAPPSIEFFLRTCAKQRAELLDRYTRAMRGQPPGKPPSIYGRKRSASA